MFSIHWFRHWDKIFWVVFVVMGLAVTAGWAVDLVSFEFFVLLGLFIVIIGAGKLAEEISKHNLMNYQDDMYRKLHQISNHLERTFNLAESYKTKTEFRLHKLEQRRKEMEIKTERNYSNLARKIIEMENRTNRISKILIEREKSRFETTGEDFAENVLSLVKRVPRGKVTTYFEIAKTVGNPKSSRAVGKVLASNVHLKTVPFHRVVKSNGRIVSGTGARKRRTLLKKEGIKVEKGRVDLGKHRFSFIPKI
jgi:O-6-methylguanine DNA methyltransferase